MKVSGTHRTIAGVLLTTLFMTYYASITLFSHTHVISGATITHSHIHTDAHHNTKSGGHTTQNITLIAQFSHFEYVGFSGYHVPTPQQFYLQHSKPVHATHWVTSPHLQSLSLRAPPIV